MTGSPTPSRSIDWSKPWDQVLDLAAKPVPRWFVGGELNTCHNCLDRHVDTGRGEQAALVYDSPVTQQKRTYRYAELRDTVARFAGVLTQHGVAKGDRVIVYMPMIPEALIAMLACARIGAVHSVVFGAFSPDSLEERINDSTCKILITQDTALRGPKDNIPMKTNADTAVAQCPSIEKVIVVTYPDESEEEMRQTVRLANG